VLYIICGCPFFVLFWTSKKEQETECAAFHKKIYLAHTEKDMTTLYILLASPHPLKGSNSGTTKQNPIA